VVTGHSRGGKTALLTGALDERVAVVVPNASGGGGFQCWRFPLRPSDTGGVNRHEDVELMGRLRHYWLHQRLKTFLKDGSDLPFDQNFLAALVAPRALCAVESMDDECATPLCVQRTFLATQRVYGWLDATGQLGIYFRQQGGHLQGPEDWAALLDFAGQALGNIPVENRRSFDRLPYPDADPATAWDAPFKPA
jgi:hypothetical protein